MPSSSITCSRCDNPTGRVYMPSGARCLPCFSAYLERTFRTSLGHTGYSGASVSFAVAVSGGPCSTALAFLTHQYMSSLKRPPHRPAPPLKLIHIAPSAGASEALYAVRALADRLPSAHLVCSSLPKREKLLLCKVRDANDASLLLRDGVRNAALRAADAADAVLFGVSATRGAALVLEEIVVGRAPRAMQVRVAEPLRGVSTRLLVRYARMKMANGSLFSAGTIRAPIPDIVAKFVAAADEDNPSSVHNVVRTAAKLVHKHGASCALCETEINTRECCQMDRCADKGPECARVRRLCRPCEEIARRARKGREKEDGNLCELVKVRVGMRERERIRAGQRRVIEEFILTESDGEDEGFS